MIAVLTEIGKLALEAAPTLASAFLSPAAGLALSLVSDAIGGDPAKPESVLSAAQNHPALAEALKTVELKYAPMLKPLIGNALLSSAKVTIELNWANDQQGMTV